MSLLYMNGFDHYTVSTGAGNRLYELDPSNWFRGTAGFFDAYCQDMPAMPVLGGKGLKIPWTDTSSGGAALNQTQASYRLPATLVSGNTIGIGFYFYGTVPAQTRGLVACGSSSVLQTLVMTLTSAGALAFRIGTTSGTLVGTTANGVIATNVLSHIELKIFVHASTGTIDIRVNSASVLSATGQNTLSSPVAEYVNFSQGGTNLVGGDAAAFYQIKNLYIWDGAGSQNNNLLGEQKVYTLFPSADTADADWTKSTGSNGYDIINDVPAVDATRYLDAATVGDVSIFDLTDLPTTALTVAGVLTTVRAEKTDAGGGTLDFGVVHGGVPSLGSVAQVNAQYRHSNKISELNPSTSAIWLSTEVNAAQIELSRTV